MARKVDLTEELGLEFKIDDFIRRHMSDIELRPVAAERRREDDRTPGEQYSMGRTIGKPELSAQRPNSALGARSRYDPEEQENEPRCEEPKLEDLERYRAPLAPLPPAPKQASKRPEITVSVPVSVRSSALPSPSVCFERIVPVPIVPEPPKAKKYDPFELPDIPPLLYILGHGGMTVSIRNKESDYSHTLTLGNLRSSVRDIPQIQNLHYFPGPVDSTTPIPLLFKYCNERAKDSYLWELLKLQLTLPCSFFDPADSQETVEKVKGALTGSISRLKLLIRAGKTSYSPFYSSVPGAEVAQENADLLKTGKLEEALSHALATREI